MVTRSCLGLFWVIEMFILAPPDASPLRPHVLFLNCSQHGSGPKKQRVMSKLAKHANFTCNLSMWSKLHLKQV